MSDIPLSPLQSSTSFHKLQDQSSDGGSGFSTPTAGFKNVAFSRLPSHRHGGGADVIDAPVFSGPPPPIARSMYMAKPYSPSSSQSHHYSSSTLQDGHQVSSTGHNIAASLASIGSAFFDTSHITTLSRAHNKPPARAQHNPDSVWRRIQLREKSLSEELQLILDVQSQALTRGLGNDGHIASYNASHPQSSGGSTPTGNLYSQGSASFTKSSHMKMSLHQLNDHGPNGVVMPVRQPKTSKKPSLRAARRSLLDTLAELRSLKQHEHQYIKNEAQVRNSALSRAKHLTARQLQISTELGLLENNTDEELAQELHSLETEHDGLCREIRELEERLVLLQKKRRWVDDKILNIRGKREAGLSGYRGALKEVDEEISTFMHQPPVEPLQAEAYAHLHVVDSDGVRITSPGGNEFLALVPERRTLNLARDWWEAEVRILKAREEAVAKEIVALDEGAEVWAATIKLVTQYESSLSEQMKKLDCEGNSDDSQSADNTIDQLVAQMDAVMNVLKQNLQLATTKKWNLLICAIGAELEAFEEAESMLRFGSATPRKDVLLESYAPQDAKKPQQQSNDVLTKPTRSVLVDMQEQRENQVVGADGHKANADHDKTGDTGSASKFEVSRSGLAASSSPVSSTKSSESMPSPAFKPYRHDGDVYYSDNEVPADFLT
ncbi:hypothetical protein HOO65_070167 [Ceratocystis lukuohia]|uniref:Autophagy-related protein 28 n=1 Tax=Ceratocystis lukuohia TaxID=2019550 RepID=A0ABR4MBQ7_9PEZI